MLDIFTDNEKSRCYRLKKKRKSGKISKKDILNDESLSSHGTCMVMLESAELQTPAYSTCSRHPQILFVKYPALRLICPVHNVHTKSL